jgi:broad specificity phosphatase PhoE
MVNAEEGLSIPAPERLKGYFAILHVLDRDLLREPSGPGRSRFAGYRPAPLGGHLVAIASELRPGEIVVVRHGETEWSRTRRHTGRTDVPLEQAGKAQAAEVRARLAGSGFDVVLVSPLERARETCLLAGFGDGATIVGDLHEWDYGAYEGLTTEEIEQLRPGWDLWEDGCPGGETAADVGRRMDSVLDVLRTGGAGKALVVAHGHVLRVFAARWLGLPPQGGRLLALAPATISRLGWEHGAAVVQCWNS